MIKLTEWLYFMKVAELQNITRASIHLHVSQPSLSRSIKSFERETGYPLFERADRIRIHLNRQGEAVYRHGKAVFADDCDVFCKG